MTYGAALWGETVVDRTMKSLLLKAQRKTLLAVTGAYGTTSADALPVLLGVLPLDLAARQLGRVARSRRNGDGKEKEMEIEEETLRDWQTRWDASDKGRILYSYFPSVRERLKCSWIEVGHESSQFLTEHGAFMYYLHRFSKSETDECTSCGASDTVSHIIFDCEAMADTRRALRDLVEADGLPWPCELRRLVDTPGIWKQFRAFIHDAVVSRGKVVGRRLDDGVRDAG